MTRHVRKAGYRPQLAGVKTAFGGGGHDLQVGQALLQSS